MLYDLDLGMIIFVVGKRHYMEIPAGLPPNALCGLYFIKKIPRI